jgi:hypothetical protein
MDRTQYTDYRTLQDSGVKLSKQNQIQPNAGSETIKHLVAKTLVGYIGLVNGYKVDSEVEIVKHSETIGEVDCLLWGHPKRLTTAVEVETSPEENTMQDKKMRYIDGTAIQEIQVINVTELPLDMIEGAEQIGDELGLNL